MKVKIATKLLKKSQKLGGFVFKHFEALSWVFIFLMISSFVVTVVGAYNFVAYGNCNGPHSTERCMLNPTGSLGCGSEHCAADGCECGTKESNCTADNNYAACKGKCDCNPEVCG